MFEKFTGPGKFGEYKRWWKIIVFLILVFVACVALVSNSFAEPVVGESGRRYLKIGGDPVNSNRELGVDEEVQVSTQDLWVVTTGKSRKVYRGWIPKGTELVTTPTSDSTLRKAVWVKKCGNDLLNPEDKAIYFRVQADVPVGRQIAGSESSSETRAPVPTVLPAVRTSIQPTTEKKCFGKGTWMTGAGTLLTGVGVGIGHWGYLLAVPGVALTYLGAKDNESDPACKAVAAVVGGIGGYVTGHAYKVSHEGGELSSSLGSSPPPPGNN